MRFPLMAMLLTGFAIIVAILGVMQLTRNNDKAVPDTTEGSVEQTTETGERSAVRPISFGTVSEINGMLRMAGTSEPDATVSIVSGGAVAQQTRADDNGMWSAVLPVFGTDTQMIDLVMSLPSGDNIRSDETLFRIPYPSEVNDADDTIQSATPPSAKPPLILRTMPGAPSKLIQSPFGSVPTVGPLSLGPIDYDDSGGAVFRGMSERPGRVRLSVEGGGVIGDQPVLDDGQWFFIVGETLPTGTYNMSIRLMTPDMDDVVLTVPFERLSPRRGQQVEGFAVSALYRENSWQVRRELLGGGAQYTVIFAKAIEQENAEEELRETQTP
ncbi:hypothetical protein [Fretibacter rubidus]|uniref:hypothetical protein n=1 Tax=Fretibacter rubidus TaxID=570162 RepID=UPI00352B1925